MSLSKRLREHLTVHGPATASTLAKALIPHIRYGASTVRNTLHRMEDAFISDWVRAPGVRGGYAAIWDVVEVPLDAPRPSSK